MNSRHFILFSILLSSTALASGQDKKVALGLGFSPTLNWMKASSEDLDSDGSKIGYTYGLLADFNFGENYALATGIFINNGGGQVRHISLRDSAEIGVTTNYKVQYLQIPITLRMRTKEIGYLKYYGQFGFNPELAIGAKGDVTAEGESTRENATKLTEVTDLNLSLVLGLGIIYNLSGTTNFVLGISYHNGFVDMLKGSSGGFTPVEKKATTNQIALNLGVLF